MYYTHIHIYISIYFFSLSLYVSLSLYIYIYIYTYVDAGPAAKWDVMGRCSLHPSCEHQRVVDYGG